MAAAHAVSAEGLVKRYGRVRALDGLDLYVDEGTLLAVLGPNGAGKTTAYKFDAGRRPRGAPGRTAMAAAGNDRAAVAAVMQLIDRLGFDAVDAGPLEAGSALEPDGSVFGASYSADELSDLLWPEASTA